MPEPATTASLRYALSAYGTRVYESADARIEHTLLWREAALALIGALPAPDERGCWLGLLPAGSATRGRYGEGLRVIAGAPSHMREIAKRLAGPEGPAGVV